MSGQTGLAWRGGAALSRARHGRRALLAAVMSGSLSAVVGVEQARAADAEPVYRALRLRSADDEPTSLALQARGRHLVVVVMKGHWCQVCIAQLQRLAALESELKALGATVVGLNADSVKANRRVMEQMNLAHPILSDAKHEVIEGLGLWSAAQGIPLPAIVIFDRCGREQARRVGRVPGDKVEAELLKVLKDIRRKTKSCDQANS